MTSARDFVAVDVETANASLASICQIGVAAYRDGLLAHEWKSYVDPEDFFDPINISIHGIDDTMVEGAPKLPDVAAQLCTTLQGAVVVCHTHFDRTAFSQAFEKYGLHLPSCEWLDTARVTRRQWPEFAQSGYGLANVCDFLAYEYQAHDALEDAKAAAHVLLAAIERSGLDIAGWLKRSAQRIGGDESGKIARQGDPNGTLYGETIVFTGALCTPRREAADLAQKLGCDVADAVSKRTTLLVVGDQDARKLAGHEKSTKHRKAEEMIAKGARIRIIDETGFAALGRG